MKSLLLLLLALPVLAQEPKFEVAAIHRRTDPPNVQEIRNQVNDPSRYEAKFATITSLIQLAYGVDTFQVSGPESITRARFDIVAKLPDGATRAEVPKMLQALLAERLKLQIHREQRDTPVTVLLVAKDGARMKAAGPDAGSSKEPATAGKGERMTLYAIANSYGGTDTISVFNQDRTVFESEKIDMPELCRALRQYVEGPFLDRTDLTGTFEVALDVPRMTVNAAARGVRPGDGLDPDISLFSSIQKLGLRLERQKIPLEYIVIDHVELEPTGN